VKEYVVKQFGPKASFSLSAHAALSFNDFFSSRTAECGLTSEIRHRGIPGPPRKTG
jgi:hypothetical protein